MGALVGCGGQAGSEAPSPQELVRSSLEAMGVETASPPTGFVVFAEGVWNPGAERQGRSPSSDEPVDFEETLALDLDGKRLGYEYRYEKNDGGGEWLREIYESGARTLVVRDEGFTLRQESEDFAAERMRLWRRFPHLLLLEALERENALRVGNAGPEGRPRLLFSLGSGEELELAFDVGEPLLRRVSYRSDVQSYGDAEIVWSYDDYRPVEGVAMLPGSYRVSVAGRELARMRVTRAAREPSAWEPFMQLPAGAPEPLVRPYDGSGGASARAEVETLAPGVHRIRHLRPGFHPLFVELADSVVVVDAPAGYRMLMQIPAGDVAPGPSSAWLSERLLDLVETAVPGKPVSHVVLTHFHNDHAGGLRAFVARGAVVVGPAAIGGAVRALVDAPHESAPDRLAREPQPLAFEPVSDRLILGSGDARIEVLSAAANPHVDDMLIVHVPHARIAFTSDLVVPAPLEAFPSSEREALARFYLEWLDTRGLEPERTFTMHALDPVTPAHLEKLRRAPIPEAS